jgi:hypothetical protein
MHHAVTTSTSFQDGRLPTSTYAGTRDATLDGAAPSTNRGSDTRVSVDGDGQKAGLL